MTEEKNNITIFLDTLGRTIIGTLTDGDEFANKEDKIAIKNPAILNIIPTDQGSMQVQVIPIVFRELQGDREEEVVWYYNPDNITMNSGFALDFKIVSQYQTIFSPAAFAPAAAPAPAPADAAPEVIKLFDD